MGEKGGWEEKEGRVGGEEEREGRGEGEEMEKLGKCFQTSST